MSPADREYWPFQVPPPDHATDHDREVVRFMEQAHAAGYRPCRFLSDDFGLDGKFGRTGLLTRRSRPRRNSPGQWEVTLVESEQATAAFWADNFSAAAEALLRWSAGKGLETVLVGVKEHITKGPRLGPIDSRADPVGESDTTHS